MRHFIAEIWCRKAIGQQQLTALKLVNIQTLVATVSKLHSCGVSEFHSCGVLYKTVYPILKSAVNGNIGNKVIRKLDLWEWTSCRAVLRINQFC